MDSILKNAFEGLSVVSAKSVLIGATVVLVIAIILFIVGGVTDSTTSYIFGAILLFGSLGLYAYGYYMTTLDNFTTAAVTSVAGLMEAPPQQ